MGDTLLSRASGYRRPTALLKWQAEVVDPFQPSAHCRSVACASRDQRLFSRPRHKLLVHRLLPANISSTSLMYMYSHSWSLHPCELSWMSLDVVDLNFYSFCPQNALRFTQPLGDAMRPAIIYLSCTKRRHIITISSLGRSFRNEHGFGPV
jgi:hypothetical protein